MNDLYVYIVHMFEQRRCVREAECARRKRKGLVLEFLCF